MLATLKFVQGAVSKKDFVPALSHFRIRNGRITGFDGKLSISAPIAIDLDCCPKAETFVRAIEACGETVAMKLNDARKLAIRSGKFRAVIETVDEANYPDVVPEGVMVAHSGELLPALRLLYEFTAEDASRPWATGVLFNGQSAFATNNVVLVEHWLGYHFPYRVNLPRYAVREVLRIGEEPENVQLTQTSMTLHYSGERWLRMQLNEDSWPDATGLLNGLPTSAAPVPEGFFDALATLKPFTEGDSLGRVYVCGDRVATAMEDGASIDVPGLPAVGCYNLRMLMLLQDVATHIGFDQYPGKVPLYGVKLRGCVMGMVS
jgi:hypothetical protein